MFFKRKNNGINPHSGYSIALALFIKLFSFHSLHWSFQEPGDDPGTHERCSEILRSCGYYRIGVCPGNAGQNARTHTGHWTCNLWDEQLKHLFSPWNHGLSNPGTASLLLAPPPQINKHLSLLVLMVIFSTCSQSTITLHLLPTLFSVLG